MLIADLLYHLFAAMVLADPGMQGVAVDAQLPGRLGNRLIRLDCQFDSRFSEFSRVFICFLFLTHKTHSSVVSSLLPVCPEKSSPFKDGQMSVEWMVKWALNMQSSDFYLKQSMECSDMVV